MRSPSLRLLNSAFLTLAVFVAMPSQASAERSLALRHLKDRLSSSEAPAVRFSGINRIDSQCLENVTETERLAQQYFEQKDSGALKKIQDLLISLESSQTTCFQTSASALVFVSLIYLNEKLVRSVPGYSPPTAILSNIFSLNGKLKFLTPSVRSKMDDLWQARSETGGYRIQGGYDCSSSTIYIDIFQPLFDLAASTTHEMDHFFRDKFSDPSTKEIPAKKRVILDETLAAITAGFYEILRSLYAAVDKDLNMFRSAGSLYQIWLWFVSLYRQDSFNSPTALIHLGFLSAPSKHTYFWQASLVFDPLLSPRADQLEVIEELRDEIYQLVSMEYFGSKLTKQELQDFQPAKLSIDLDPFLMWIRSNRQINLFGGQNAKASANSFSKYLFKKSESCRQFEQSLEEKELQDYLAPFATLRPEQKSPTDTTRRHSSTIKPCVDMRDKL